MLLNKLNVLDKGFVSLLTTSGNGKLLQQLQDEYFKTKTQFKLLEISSATLIIKCPLFVQLNLSQYGLNIITTPSDNIEAYLPDLSMIDGNSLEIRNDIQQYIKETTDALLINQTGFSTDGVSKFTAQLLTPLSVYNELIIHGSLSKWLNYIQQKNLPKEIELYRSTIESVLSVEWKNLGSLK